MAAGKRIDRSFLGESALRLARLLGVGGLISPQFDSEETIQPVVLVGDASGIGYRGQALRAFAYGETVAAAAGFTSKLAIKAPLEGNGIIIDGWIIGATGTTGVGVVSVLAPDTADPWTIAQVNVLWAERMTRSAERSGILTAPQNADALTYGIDLLRFQAPNNANPVPVTAPLMLLPGGKAIISLAATNTALHASFWGRAL